jgi:hypothetical protein
MNLNEQPNYKGDESRLVHEESMLGQHAILKEENDTEAKLSKEESALLHESVKKDIEGIECDLFELNKQSVDIETELSFVQDEATEKYGYDLEDDKELVYANPTAVDPLENQDLMHLKHHWQELKDKQVEVGLAIKRKKELMSHFN